MKVIIFLFATFFTLVLFSLFFPIPKIFPVPFLDKLYHLVAYLLFTLFLALTLSNYSSLSDKFVLLSSIGIAILIGAVLEGIQLFTRTRTPDIMDFLFNCLGALLGYVLYLFLFIKK